MGGVLDAASFVELFKEIEDPRVERTRLHPLSSILLLCLCGVISGADTVVEIEEYGTSKLDFLQTMLPFPHGIPSHDTIGRVLAKLNPIKLEQLFAHWMSAAAELCKGEVVAIDGKTLRRAWDKHSGGEFVHMVSAWASANRMVLGQVRTDSKSNEISAIPHLLELLSIRGAIVTIDAIGCQTKIAEQIVDQGADYLLAVKENQPQLLKAVRESFESLDPRKTGKRASFCETQEYGHGRSEIRRCSVGAAKSTAQLPEQWSSVASIVRIEAERTDGTKAVQESTRYYVSSRVLSAKEALASARAHWSVENGLHWVLDVAFREDDSRARAENAAENFAVIRHIALNLLRASTTKRIGIKVRRFKAACSDAFLAQVLCGTSN
jgi:predicted transposase YbfD/YdcC